MVEFEETSTEPVWVLLGPTAGGKTRMSLSLARGREVEIVSVDSMQVYRGMNIGTAKAPEARRRRVPHHMIDIVDPWEWFNAAEFSRRACEAIRDIRRRGRRALLVCGTPFYLRALLWGLFEGPGAHPGIRERLRAEARESGVEALHRRLVSVDPEAAEGIGIGDYKRIERALEVHEVTGVPISEQQVDFSGPPRIPAVFVGLHWARGVLYERINRRVDSMVGSGLIGEVCALRGSLGVQARQAVGYKETLSYLDGDASLEEAVELIKRNTRRFAKDQAGWFRKFPVRHWVELDEDRDVDEAVDECLHVFRGGRS